MRKRSRVWLAGAVALAAGMGISSNPGYGQVQSRPSKRVAPTSCAKFNPTSPFAGHLPSQDGAQSFESNYLDPFLDQQCYLQAPFGYRHDQAEKRWTIHGWVRIYYSPPVVSWLSPPNNRQGEIPEGALIVKEQYLDEGEKSVCWWTTMTKDSQGSKDGWFWSMHFNPNNPDQDDCSAGSVTPRDAQINFPGAVAGKSDCLNCHGSAVSESTYSDWQNIEAALAAASRRRPPASIRSQRPREGPHRHRLPKKPAAGALALGAKPTLPPPDPGFLAAYGIKGSVQPGAVKALPGEALDNVVAGPTGPEQYISSSQCIGCHDATYNTANLIPADSNDPPPPPNMILPEDLTKSSVNLSPYAEQHASIMGLSGRDPVFFAQLETEGVVHSPAKASIQNTCFGCHGVMGQRQLELDSKGQQMFSLDMVYATGSDPNAKYGALARDGVSCAVCHHIVIDEQVPFDQTFTGKFFVGPASELYGPYQEDIKIKPMDNSLGVTPKYSPLLKDGSPMIHSAKLCGSCHTVYIDVLDNKGHAIKKTFEQATYLEWLNSDFQNEIAPYGATPKVCQDCHMQQTYHQTPQPPLAFKIANIEDSTYTPIFPLKYQLPDPDIALKVRQPFYRHTLMGINLFTFEMFNQFADAGGDNPILGIRNYDPMTTGQAAAPLSTAIDTALNQALSETATIQISSVAQTASALTAVVQVTNLTGHHFPSGVGFRRAFIELQVLDGAGQPLWVSGATDAYGRIVGSDGQPLPSEFFQPMPFGKNYQPHWETIDSAEKVQIYEELTKSPPPESKFTTSFLSLYEHVKDNRLQPHGWKYNGPYAEVTQPDGAAVQDCSYGMNPKCPSYGKPSTGSDTITYQVPLAALKGKPAQVQATLYYQSIPPYYLADRFSLLKRCAGQDLTCFPETYRLLYLTSALNLNGTEIAGWKLQVSQPQSAKVPPS